jgi:hypothetical protein
VKPRSAEELHAMEQLFGTNRERLSAGERDALERCEQKIRRGLRSNLEMGEGFREIRDRRLYKERHPTFDAYTRDVWGMARSTAYDYIAFADVAANVGTSQHLSLGHAHVLARLPAGLQRKLAPGLSPLPVSAARAAVPVALKAESEGRLPPEGPALDEFLRQAARQAARAKTKLGSIPPFAARFTVQIEFGAPTRWGRALEILDKANEFYDDGLDLWKEALELAARDERAGEAPLRPLPWEVARFDSLSGRLENRRTRAERLLAATHGQLSLDDLLLDDAEVDATDDAEVPSA